MKAQLAVLADSANLSQEGKLNILGEFNTLYGPEEPVAHPLMWFVGKLAIEGPDIGKHQLLLRVINEDGDTVFTPATGEIDLQLPSGQEFMGEYGAIPVLVQVLNAQFPGFGTYVFELRVDDQIVAEVPLRVSQLIADSPPSP